MIPLEDNSTIIAISSGLKNAAIGVIRISGENSLDYLSKVFQSKSGKKIKDSPGYRVYFGKICDNGEILDEVVVIVYRSPKSYTGEDMVEIFCHGNLILMEKIVNLFINLGCRLAKPGEFTLRAVLNKKIDLTQALAIRDLIESPTEQMLKLSLKNLKGALSSKINFVREKLLYWLVWIEASLDFPEEDIPALNNQELKQDLENLIEQIKNINSNYEKSKIYRQGIDTVIIGKPNVGKSTLFNYLYGQERVIISEIPGTTRDIISEFININGIILKLYDTAGFRKTKDQIEKIGIEKAKEIIKKSQLVLWVLEFLNLDENDLQVYQTIENHQKLIIIINKIDKAKSLTEIENFEKLVRNFAKTNLKNEQIQIVSCSITKNLNLEELKEKIVKICGSIDENTILIDEFQYQTLQKIHYFLEKTLKDFHLSTEVIAINLKEALNSIAELTGENITETVIDNMLSRFCIGK
ncbi:MAG: tRNA uridine-5-carboxymethylaminomethyl(34) synthesis GTPase MnmE [bacterium]